MVLTPTSFAFSGVWLIASLAQAFPQNNYKPGVLSFPLKAREPASIVKRQKGVELSKSSSEYNHMQHDELAIDLDIGSSTSQRVTVTIDTGSFRSWVNPDCGGLDELSKKHCVSCGHFDPKKSGGKNLKRNSEIKYDDETRALIDHYSEKITFNKDLALDDQVIGVASTSVGLSSGILGLSEPIAGYEDFDILENMVRQKAISTASFSIDAGHIGRKNGNGNIGSIVFGGVDYRKFRGSLERRDIIQPQGSTKVQYNIMLDSVSLFREWDSEPIPAQLKDMGATVTKGFLDMPATDEGFPVLLDTGANMDYLPPDVVELISNVFDGEHIEGNFVVPCDISDLKGGIRYKFGSTIIEKTFSDLLVPGSKAIEIEGEEYCTFRIQSTDEGVSLGMPFFESTYVVFDRSKKEVHLAPADDCGTTVLPIHQDSNSFSTKSLCEDKS